jgi:hypothetical protein
MFVTFESTTVKTVQSNCVQDVTELATKYHSVQSLEICPVQGVWNGTIGRTVVQVVMSHVMPAAQWAILQLCMVLKIISRGEWLWTHWAGNLSGSGFMN